MNLMEAVALLAKGEPIHLSADSGKYYQIQKGIFYEFVLGDNGIWIQVTPSATAIEIASVGWAPYKPFYVTFSTALDWMRSGYRARRRDWDNQSLALIHPPGSKNKPGWLGFRADDKSPLTEWKPTHHDLVAEDWVLKS